uniref:Uncharacterized protein n=1 Tax=Meloidogyne floridensis TaxID=298350 RepID=A0A915PAN9_9BILA
MFVNIVALLIAVLVLFGQVDTTGAKNVGLGNHILKEGKVNLAAGSTIPPTNDKSQPPSTSNEPSSTSNNPPSTNNDPPSTSNNPTNNNQISSTLANNENNSTTSTPEDNLVTTTGQVTRTDEVKTSTASKGSSTGATSGDTEAKEEGQTNEVESLSPEEKKIEDEIYKV